MKSIHSLRILNLLGFLLLITPFYDHCNGRGMKKTEEAPVEAPIEELSLSEVPVEKIVVDTISKESIVEKDTLSSIKVEEESFSQKTYEFIDDKDSYSAFEIAMCSESFFNITFKEFKSELIEDLKKGDVSGIASYIFIICFIFIDILIFLILLFSFKNKWLLIYKLSFINLCLLLISIICILFDPFFEEIKQIKWGYYVFTVVQIMILVLSKKEKKLKP